MTPKKLCIALAAGAALIPGVLLAANASRPAGPNGRAPTLAETVSGAQASANDEQAPALADGVVTWDEHEAAIAKVASCLESQGVSVTVETAAGHRPSSVGFAAPSLDAAERARALLEGCKQTYLSQVDAVWLAANRPTPSDIERGAAYVRDCLGSAGQLVYPASGAVNGEQLAVWLQDPSPAFHDAVIQCLVTRRQELGY